LHAVQTYRIYELNHRGRPIGRPTLVTCENPRQAVERAQALRRHRTLEIWRHSAIIERLEPLRRALPT
jgi:hypothetical protein